MELILFKAIFSVYWLFSGLFLLTMAWKEYKDNRKVTFEVLADVVWAIGDFAFSFIMATDVHHLFARDTVVQIVMAIYAVMIAMLLVHGAHHVASKFKERKILSGIGMIFAFILTTSGLFMTLVPMLMFLYVF